MLGEYLVLALVWCCQHGSFQVEWPWGCGACRDEASSDPKRGAVSRVDLPTYEVGHLEVIW